MSFLDSVLADTVGVAYRAVTGNVDPWTKTNIQEETAAGVAQALGPNASPQATQDAQNSASQLITDQLLSSDADPSQAGIRIPGLGTVGSGQFLANVDKIVNGAIVVGLLIF